MCIFNYLLLISIIICFEFVFESVIVNYTFRIHVHIFADLFSNYDTYLCNFVSISIQWNTNQNIIRTIHFKSVSFAIFHGATNSGSHFSCNSYTRSFLCVPKLQHRRFTIPTILYLRIEFLFKFLVPIYTLTKNPFNDQWRNTVENKEG